VPVDRRTVLRAGAFAAASPLLAACGALDNLVTSGVVRVAVSWSDAELAAFQLVLNGFRKQSQYEVDVIPLGDDIADAVTSQVNGKPDIVMLPRPGLIVPNLSRIAPLPPGAWHPRWLSDGWQDNVWHADVPYGLPFKVANQSALWYRQDVFDALHLNPPTTWSQWLDVNDTLLRNGITPLSIGGGDGWPLTAFFANVLRGWAADSYGTFANPSPPPSSWRGVAFTQALRLLGGMLSVRGVLSGGVDRTLAQQYPDSIVDVFGYHNAAMVVSADYAAPVVTEFTRPPAVAGVMPFPAVDGINPGRVGPGDEDLAADPRRNDNLSSPLIVGADIAVVLQPASRGANDFVRWLAQPDTPVPWISGHGGFIAANRQTPASDYDALVEPLLAPFTTNDPFVFDLSDAMGSLGGSGALFSVLENFLRAVGDGRSDRIVDAANSAADRMTDIEAADGH
jgi:alpha-glucoside transport system substrate-binding protein